MSNPMEADPITAEALRRLADRIDAFCEAHRYADDDQADENDYPMVIVDEVQRFACSPAEYLRYVIGCDTRAQFAASVQADIDRL